ncbi:MAG: SU10 major capsid protein [bacterium]
MAIAGLRGNNDWGTSERPQNFREMILWRDPNGSAPLTALMARMRKETTDDPQFHWWEEELKAIRIQLSAQVVTAGVTLTLDTTEDATGADLVAGDLLLVEETPAAAATYGFEIMQVSSVVSSASIVVSRGAAGTTANTGTVVTSSYLLKIGSAFEEGAAAPDASSRNPTKYTNYTQIFKTAYNLTNTAIQTKIRTGDPLNNDKKRRMFDHAVAMEQGFLFGYANETTGATLGQPLRYTGGLYSYLVANYNATTAPTIKVWTTTAVTEEDILDACYGMWDYNVPESGSERIGLCGNGFLNYLNKIVLADSASRINYDGVIDVFGMKLMRWNFPQGTIYLRTHPLMNTNSFYTNGAFFINPPGVKYRPMKGRDTKFEDNIQLPGADQKKGQWITECGAEFHHLKSMRYLGIHV